MREGEGGERGRGSGGQEKWRGGALFEIEVENREGGGVEGGVELFPRLRRLLNCQFQLFGRGETQKNNPKIRGGKRRGVGMGGRRCC